MRNENPKTLCSPLDGSLLLDPQPKTYKASAKWRSHRHLNQLHLPATVHQYDLTTFPAPCQPRTMPSKTVSSSPRHVHAVRPRFTCQQKCDVFLGASTNLLVFLCFSYRPDLFFTSQKKNLPAWSFFLSRWHLHFEKDRNFSRYLRQKNPTFDEPFVCFLVFFVAFFGEKRLART